MAARIFRAVLCALTLALPLGACGDKHAPADEHGHEAAAEEFPRGPHRGRLLSDGDFSLEVTIFEDGAPPQFRFYAYMKGKPLAPGSVTATAALTRLGGKVDHFTFTPQGDYLQGSRTVVEPHSFDVAINATHAGQTHAWKYPSYEGRTTIAPDAAAAGGVKVEAAGPAVVDESLDLAGKVVLEPSAQAQVKAWFPGRIVALTPKVGDMVRRGQTIARVESAQSLQTYAIPAPISGVVIERAANVGDVAGEGPILVIADPSRIQAELFVFPRDAERVRAGQPVVIKATGGQKAVTAKIAAFLPMVDFDTQTLTARVPLPPAAWRPGQAVEGRVQVESVQAPLAVRTRALQRFRDFTVVFARVGNTYEVRMLELGRQTPEWTEVLGGLAAGEVYVTDGAFLIRADIEKSGASHDH